MNANTGLDTCGMSCDMTSHYYSPLLISRANSGQLHLNFKMPVTKQHIMIPAATAPIVAVAMEIRFKSFRSQDGAP